MYVRMYREKPTYDNRKEKKIKTPCIEISTRLIKNKNLNGE